MFEKTILCHERFDSVRLEELAQASYHVKEDLEQVLHAGKMRPARGLDKPAARHPKRLFLQFATHRCLVNHHPRHLCLTPSISPITGYINAPHLVIKLLFRPFEDMLFPMKKHSRAAGRKAVPANADLSESTARQPYVPKSTRLRPFLQIRS